MTRILRVPTNAVAFAARALVFTLMLAAPVLALPSISGGQGMVIEAPASKNSGIGFVLLVSLQRQSPG